MDMEAMQKVKFPRGGPTWKGRQQYDIHLNWEQPKFRSMNSTQIKLTCKLRGRGNILRTSLYADDAAVFVAPIKSDIRNLAAILHDFGKVTGLCTNFLKSSVAPIRCGEIDLDDVLQDIPAARASFPLQYLGLPLSIWSLSSFESWRRLMLHHGCACFRWLGSCRVTASPISSDVACHIIIIII
jgi:hypothetical protein